MKFLLLPVICLLASCAGNGTMTVVSKNSEGMTVSANWRQHAAMWASTSATKAKAWFAKEATKLAQAENKQVSSVQIQSATLKYHFLGGVCDITLGGAAYYGGSSAGAGVFDGTNLMAQANAEDVKIVKYRTAMAAIGAAAAAFGEGVAAANAQHQVTIPDYTPVHTSPPITVPTLTHTDMYEETRNFHLKTPHMTFNPPQSSLLNSYSSASRRSSIPTLSSSSLAMPTYSSSSYRAPTYSPSNNMGLSSGLATRSGQLSGNTYYHPNGTTSTKQGNTWFHPGGRTSTRVGETVYNSNGTSSTKQGNTWFHSNGKTSTKVGNTIQNSDGTSYTLTPGGTLYYNGKGL